MKRILLAISFALFAVPALAADAKRPNILFAFADDWGRYASAYAKLDGPGSMNDVVRTPNIDRVAKEGILFRHAFVSAPSCTPCRSALVSGQHFWRTGRGSILRGAIWDGTNVSFPLLLREAGYHIGKTYKVWTPGTPPDAPFGVNKYAYEKSGKQFMKFSNNVTKLIADGRRRTPRSRNCSTRSSATSTPSSPIARSSSPSAIGSDLHAPLPPFQPAGVPHRHARAQPGPRHLRSA